MDDAPLEGLASTMPDGPVLGRHLDGDPYIPYTDDNLAAQRDSHAPVVGHDEITLFDRYGNALAARWIGAGLRIGGILITEQADAELLAKFITREDESA